VRERTQKVAGAWVVSQFEICPLLPLSAGCSSATLAKSENPEMARGEGIMTGLITCHRQEGQDQQHFPLGASNATLAAGYEEDRKKSVRQLLAERDPD
jgi:hypothetical protein